MTQADHPDMTSAETLPPFSPTIDDINNVLDAAVMGQASDIVLKHNTVAKAKIQGEWRDIEDLPIPTISDMQDLISLMLTKEQQKTFQEEREFDFQFPTERYRFRVNAAFQSSGPMLTFRPIPKEPPLLESLNFIDPDQIIPLLKKLSTKPRGLILVTGPTGMGKSTTLASMIRFINENYARNIITIEDPIEFMHSGKKSLISQREVGSDTRSFSRALRGALRQTPDIILVGELRDPETIEAAMTAAETGHLVMGTLHTNNAPSAITRILDVMPGEKTNLIKTQLAAALVAIVTQQLIPTPDGSRKQVVLEIMVNDEGTIRNLIREGENSLNKYYDEMFKEDSESVLMDEQLAKAGRMGIIDPAAAEARAIQPERFSKIYSSLRVASGPTSSPPTNKSASNSGWGRK